MQKQIVEIAKDFFLLRSKEEDFHRNIYIKRFTGTHGDSITMVMDPGTQMDYPVLSTVLKDLIGGIKNIHLIFLSHQDPDVSSNVSAILASAPRAIVISSIDTWRLVKMYGIPEKRFKSIESFKYDTLRIKKTGHYIQFIPAYYCHFRGASMFYDHESKVLFSGDFLGGLNTRKGDGVFATEDSWEGISLFHQIYMPSKKAVQATIDRIGLLNPLPEIIAPQHGDVIRGELVAEFLGRLATLDVGIDAEERTEAEIETLIVAFNDFLSMLKMTYPDFHSILVNDLKTHGEFTTLFILTGDSISGLKLLPKDVIYHLWKKLTAITPEETHNELKGLFVSSLQKFGVEIPDFLMPSEGSIGFADIWG